MSLSLEARLGLISFHSGSFGFMTYGVAHQVSKANYIAAIIIGIFDIFSAGFAYYHGKKAVEEYKK